LNVGGILCAFQIYAAETERAIEKMDVTIHESRQHQFAAGVDHFRSHAAHAFNHRVIADGNDFSAVHCHGLGPRLFRVFRVNTAVHDDNIRRRSEPALRARE